MEDVYQKLITKAEIFLSSMYQDVLWLGSLIVKF